MNAMWNKLARKLIALHKDEQGATMVEYIMVIAAVALPLLGVIIWYWKDISKWAYDLWQKAKGQEGIDPSTL